MDYSLLLAIHKQDPTSSVVQAAVAQAKENEASGIIPTKSSSSSAGAASSTATTADGHDPLNVSHISKVSVTSTSTSGGDLIRKHASFYHYDHGGMQGIDAAAPCLYFLGIIDILQEYDFSKKLEHFAKSKLLCKDSHGISAVEPEEYRERFITAMESVFV